MKLLLTNKEIAFVCVLFEQEIPIIVLDSFKKYKSENIQKEFDEFAEKLISINILSKNGSELTLCDEAQLLFSSIFAAKIIVSLLNSNKTISCIYYSEVGISAINRIEDIFELFMITDNRESLEMICKKMKISENSSPDEIFELVIPAQDFEDLLSGKNKNYPKEEMAKIKDLSKIMNKKDGAIILTERIQHKGTILSKFINHDGTLYQSILYTENGDVISIGKNHAMNALETIMNFRGK